MAKIIPFRGVLYNKDKVGDLNMVMAPPYDVIESDELKTLYKKSIYNIIHIDLGEKYSSDNDSDNRYTRASALIEQWLKEGILIRDDTPSIYVYEMEYFINNERKLLSGFIPLVRLEEYSSGIILPHENTLPDHKSDRYNLLKACRSNISLIFSFYSSPEKIASQIIDDVRGKLPPIIEVSDRDNTIHRLWGIHEQKDINEIIREIEKRRIYIADGHHRYETALEFSKKMRNIYDDNKDAPYNWVAMFLTNIDNGDPTILPPHRLLRLENGIEIEKVLEENFDIRRLSSTGENEYLKMKELFEKMNSHRDDYAFGIFIRGRNEYLLIVLKNQDILRGRDLVERLDVSVLQELV
ncbi:MAG: DUF1015 domain-containing protein, partial [Nitrospirota bacterium]